MKFSTSFILLACSSAFAAPLLSREPSSAFSEIVTGPKIPDSVLQSLSDILESSNIVPSVQTRSAKDIVLEGIATILSGKKDKNPGSDSSKRAFFDDTAERIAQAIAEAAAKAAGGSGAGSGSDSDGGSGSAGSGSDSSSRRMIKARQGLNEKKCIFPAGFAGIIPLRCQLQGLPPPIFTLPPLEPIDRSQTEEIPPRPSTLPPSEPIDPSQIEEIPPRPSTLPPSEPIDPSQIEEAAAPEVDARQALDDASCIFPAGFKGLIPLRCRVGGPGPVVNLPLLPFDLVTSDSVPAPDVEARQGLDEANCVFPPGFEGIIPLRCQIRVGGPGPVVNFPSLPFDSVPAPDVEARQGIDAANCIFPVGFAGLIPLRCQGGAPGPVLNIPFSPFDSAPAPAPEVEARQGLDIANCRFPAGFLGLIPERCQNQGLPPFLTPPVILPDITAEPEVTARQAVDEANCVFPAGFAGLIPPECVGKFPSLPNIIF